MSELSDLFGQLCCEPSPSYSEAAVAGLIKAELDSRGLGWSEDRTGELTGSDCGNILVRIGGSQASTRSALLLCAHMDTVPPAGRPEPELVDGFWRNGSEGILGVDNKAAVAALLTAARVWALTPPPVPVELLFTTAEEVGLKGSAAFDHSLLDAEVAVMFDHPSPLGTVVCSSPAHHSFTARLRGRAAHAGVDPAAGRSAIAAAAEAITGIQSGQLDNGLTVNIGLIDGGTAINVVPEHCRIDGEVRGVDPADLAGALATITDSLQRSAEAHGCALSIESSLSFPGYDHGPSHAGRILAEAALESLGLAPVPVRSAGGSDANVLDARGIPSVNLGDGSSDTHTSEERISDADLHQLLELVLALPDAWVHASIDATEGDGGNP